MEPRRSNPRPGAAGRGRRRFLKRLSLGGLGLAAGTGRAAAEASGPGTALTYPGVQARRRRDHQVATGHTARVLLRWGDGVVAGTPDQDQAPGGFAALGAELQARQFGANCDFTAYFPLPRGSHTSGHGLLAVNHEYTPGLLWPALDPLTAAGKVTREQVAVEMAAHGISIVEIRRRDGRWQPVKSSRLSRRLHAGSPMDMAGPAAGDGRLRTSADPTGRRVLGTLNNCAGGVTPWGTLLSAEENFPYYFQGEPAGRLRADALRYGLTQENRYGWSRFHPRFDLNAEPHEPHRFGWVVEVDPYDATATPVKRTALGRFKHEGATCHLAHDGRVVVYSADDEEFEYLYRYVSREPYRPGMPVEAAGRLLDDGQLSVARFDAGGALEWAPLVHGQGPLTVENGFASQAEVLIHARRAADALDATALDRPEGVAVDPVSGAALVTFTGNPRRMRTAPGSPRVVNLYGHILKLTPPDPGKGGHAAARGFAWSVYLRCGEGQGRHLFRPDNLAATPDGTLWIATDQGRLQRQTGVPDGLWTAPAAGGAPPRLFYAAPVDSELTGPSFTPDLTTLFVSVQHPAEGTPARAPSTRWPDFQRSVPPRSSVVAIAREDGQPLKPGTG